MGSARVVVVGPYPTMPGPEALHTLSHVRSLVAGGDDVVVVSPAPSAAHHHADPAAARGAVRIAALSRGADRLFLRLEGDALARGVTGSRSLARCLALGFAVRAAGATEVRVDRVPPRVAGEWVAALLAPAERVIVSSPDERDLLVASGLAGSRVIVEEESAVVPAHRRRHRVAPEPHAPVAAGAGREALEQVLRERARSERVANPAARATATGTSSGPLRHLGRLEPAPATSARPGAAMAKRLVGKLFGWQLDTVIDHVNRLHEATIAAIESVEAQRSDDNRA